MIQGNSPLNSGNHKLKTSTAPVDETIKSYTLQKEGKETNFNNLRFEITGSVESPSLKISTLNNKSETIINLSTYVDGSLSNASNGKALFEQAQQDPTFENIEIFLNQIYSIKSSKVDPVSELFDLKEIIYSSAKVLQEKDSKNYSGIESTSNCLMPSNYHLANHHILRRLNLGLLMPKDVILSLNQTVKEDVGAMLRIKKELSSEIIKPESIAKLRENSESLTYALKSLELICERSTQPVELKEVFKSLLAIAFCHHDSQLRSLASKLIISNKKLLQLDKSNEIETLKKVIKKCFEIGQETKIPAPFELVIEILNLDDVPQEITSLFIGEMIENTSFRLVLPMLSTSAKWDESIKDKIIKSVLNFINDGLNKLLKAAEIGTVLSPQELFKLKMMAAKIMDISQPEFVNNEQCQFCQKNVSNLLRLITKDEKYNLELDENTALTLKIKMLDISYLKKTIESLILSSTAETYNSSKIKYLASSVVSTLVFNIKECLNQKGKAKPSEIDSKINALLTVVCEMLEETPYLFDKEIIAEMLSVYQEVDTQVKGFYTALEGHNSAITESKEINSIEGHIIIGCFLNIACRMQWDNLDQNINCLALMPDVITTSGMLQEYLTRNYSFVTDYGFENQEVKNFDKSKSLRYLKFLDNWAKAILRFNPENSAGAFYIGLQTYNVADKFNNFLKVIQAYLNTEEALTETLQSIIKLVTANISKNFIGGFSFEKDNAAKLYIGKLSTCLALCKDSTVIKLVLKDLLSPSDILSFHRCYTDIQSDQAVFSSGYMILASIGVVWPLLEINTKKEIKETVRDTIKDTQYHNLAKNLQQNVMPNELNLTTNIIENIKKFDNLHSEKSLNGFVQHTICLLNSDNTLFDN